jgi:hypothetical protein
MPYVRCFTCGLASYSAAKYSGRDTCPHCATELTQPGDHGRGLLGALPVQLESSTGPASTQQTAPRRALTGQS